MFALALVLVSRKLIQPGRRAPGLSCLPQTCHLPEPGHFFLTKGVFRSHCCQLLVQRRSSDWSTLRRLLLWFGAIYIKLNCTELNWIHSLALIKFRVAIFLPSLHSSFFLSLRLTLQVATTAFSGKAGVANQTTHISTETGREVFFHKVFQKPVASSVTLSLVIYH